MKKKIRPLGEITQDMESLLEEMIDDHELQAQEVIYNIWSWIQGHREGSIPTYVADNSRAVIYVGHWEGLTKKEKK